MKKQRKKKIVSALGILLALTAAASTAQAATGREGNGGAGVERDGKYMTFYSAGFYTEPTPVQDNEEIPGLNDLLYFLQQFPHISDEQRLNFINTVLPSSQHEYYKVKEDRFDAETMNRLLAEFGRVTGQPTDHLKLFAITDTNNGKTYLLPSFYQLTAQEQMTILFHENYWMVHPKSDYPTVVAAEMAFQAVVANPAKLNRVLELLKYFGSEGDQLVAMIQSDLKSGALNGLLQDKKIPMMQLLGKDFFACMEKSSYRGFACFEAVKLNVFRLSQQYPNSLLIRYLYKRGSWLGKDIRGYERRFLGRGNNAYYYNQAYRDDDDGALNETAIPLLFYTGRSFFGSYQYEPIDYTNCYLNLEMDRGFSKGAVYLPVQCGEKVKLTDIWLSSASSEY